MQLSSFDSSENCYSRRHSEFILLQKQNIELLNASDCYLHYCWFDLLVVHCLLKMIRFNKAIHSMFLMKFIQTKLNVHNNHFLLLAPLVLPLGFFCSRIVRPTFSVIFSSRFKRSRANCLKTIIFNQVRGSLEVQCASKVWTAFMFLHGVA